MGKKQPNTPRSRIRSAIRLLWMRSRERAKVLKDAKYTCLDCNVKQTRAGKDKDKWILMEVHHVDMIDVWNEIIDLIAQKILEPEQVCLCKECHKKRHKKALND